MFLVIVLLSVDYVKMEGRVEEEIGVFLEMLEKGLETNSVIYNALIDEYYNKGDMKKYFELWDTILQQGLQPSVCTYNPLIHGLFIYGKITEVKMFFERNV